MKEVCCILVKFLKLTVLDLAKLGSFHVASIVTIIVKVSLRSNCIMEIVKPYG